MELQRGYYATTHITDEIILDIFQKYQVNAKFGFGNTCFISFLSFSPPPPFSPFLLSSLLLLFFDFLNLWGEAVQPNITNTVKTPSQALQTGNALDQELLIASLDSPFPRKAFGASFACPLNPLYLLCSIIRLLLIIMTFWKENIVPEEGFRIVNQIAHFPCCL